MNKHFSSSFSFFCFITLLLFFIRGSVAIFMDYEEGTKEAERTVRVLALQTLFNQYQEFVKSLESGGEKDDAMSQLLQLSSPSEELIVSLLQNKKFLQWYEANIPKEEQVTYLLSSSSSSAPSPPSDPIFLMDAMYRSSSQDLSQLIKKEGEKKEEERDVGYGWWRRIHASASSSVRRMLGGWQGEERRREEVEECGWEFSFFGRPRIGTFVENMRKEALPYHGFGPEMPPPPPLSQSEVERLSLPLNVLVKSTTESMTHEYYAALRQGKVYYKRYYNEESGENVEDEWHLLMGDGLPRPPTVPDNNMDRVEFLFKNFNFGWKLVEPLVSLSADGDNLIIEDSSHRIHYVKFTGWIWQGKWGLNLPPVFDAGPAGWLDLTNFVDYAISHRGPFNYYYDDHFGKHIQSIGVTSLYLLSPEGQILFADPWLPPVWNRPLPGPHRDTLAIAGMDASCSTMFVIGRDGSLFTCFRDYDTLGNNIYFEYNQYYKWDKELKTRMEQEGTYEEYNQLRLLPGEDWVSHSIPMDQKFPGAILTSEITIIQIGKGTAGRELRVVGRFNGNVGIFRKKIDESNDLWSFESPQDPQGKELLEEKFNSGIVLPTDPDVLPHRLPSEDTTFLLDIDSLGKDTITNCEIRSVVVTDFHPIESPATATFTFLKGKVTVPLHTRRAIPDEGKQQISYWGVFLFPEEATSENHPANKFISRKGQEQFRRAVDVNVVLSGEKGRRNLVISQDVQNLGEKIWGNVLQMKFYESQSES